MLNFGAKELVVNSNVTTNDFYKLALYDAAGASLTVDDTNAATAAKLRIWGFGDIEKANVTKVTLNRGIVGSPQVTTIDFAGGFLAPVIEKTVRIEVVIKDGSYDAQHAKAQMEFGRDPKSYQVLVTPSDTAATVAQKFVDMVNFERDRYSNEMLTASISGTVVTLSVGSNFSHPEEVQFSVRFKDENGLGDSSSTVLVAPVVTTTKPVLSVNSAQWIRENMRILNDVTTQPYWSVTNDQLPISGAYYSELGCEVIVNREDLVGMSAVDQVVVSRKELDIFVKEDAVGAAIAANSFISVLATFLNSSPATNKSIIDKAGASGNLTAFLA